jgi:septum formation protein
MKFSVINKKSPLILASASPRRKQLLTQMGLPFRSVISHVSEKEPSGDPAEISRLLAEKKALQVYAKNKASWILGADTVVAIDHHLLGKPENRGHARQMLTLLKGKEHRVITGICILTPTGKVAHSEAITTRVWFIRLTRQQIEDYILTGEPYGKAGSYAIQGIGSFMVERISGSYTNVVGLPLCALIRALMTVGALKRFPLS